MLAPLADYATLIIGQAVYGEAVTAGIAHGHEDASEVRRILVDHAVECTFAAATHEGHESGQGSQGLGRGEREAMSLYREHAAHAVLSDDRAFLRLLDEEKIPYLTPAVAVGMLAEQGVLTGERARRALADLRPLIREEQYWAARKDLESILQGGDA